MASICDRAEDALSNLLRRCERIALSNSDPVERAFYTLKGCIERFEDEFRCLRIFLDCIHKWTDLEDVLHLGSLVGKVEATIQKIAEKLVQKTKLRLKRSQLLGSPVFIILRKMEDRFLKRKVPKLLDLFSDLMREVMDLKAEIGEACDSFSSPSFQFRLDCHQRDELGIFVHRYYKACRKRADYYSSNPLNKLFLDLNHHLFSSKNLLDCLAKGPRENLHEGALIHVGEVAVSAALRLCEWWVAGQMDQNNVRVALLELQQKMELAYPDLARWNLERLKFVKVSDESGLRNQVDEFVECFFPEADFFLKLPRYYVDWELPYSLQKELQNLVISALGTDTKNVDRLLADIKVVLTEVSQITKPDSDRVEVGIILENLLPEIWLLKLEILLRNRRSRLDMEHISQLSKQKRTKSLKTGLRRLGYEHWLKFLNITIQHSTEGNIRKLERILTLMEEVGLRAEEITIAKAMRTNDISKLLLIVVLFKADSLVMEFQSLMVFDENQIEALHRGLEFLTKFVKDQPAGTVEEGKLAFAQIEEVACRLTSLRHLLPIHKSKEEEIENMKLLVSDMLVKTRLVTAELKDIHLHAPRFNFPKTNGLGFIDSLLGKLRKLLEADLTASLKHQIEDILGNVQFLTPFLKGILEQNIESQELKDLGARIIDVAYEAEYYVDSMMLELDTVEWHNSLWLYHLLEDIRHLKTSVTRVYSKTQHGKGQDVPQTSVQNDTKATPSRTGEIVVVLNDEEEMIIDRLLGGTPKLDIVPIVGMPGIGKTTLAKQVFKSPSVMHHFHMRTWCCVSEFYRKREVLLEILNHITPLTDDILGTNEDLESRLRKLLLKNKYLIVMDDLWNSEALDDLGNVLPDDGNGSRILITSRNHRVVSKANPRADPHFLRQLSDAESWNLLQMKVFHNEDIPEELREIGEQITRSCRGLPLAIVAVAGLLQKRERQYSSWKEIADDLSFIVDPDEQCRQILELSYKHLPDYLKACFLYFSAFLEDQDIPAWKLMQIWIAEGFVQKTESKSLEEVAEDYLMDLIDRSLVLFSQRRSRGGVKACRIHDVLRKMCQTKAETDKFLQVITTRSDESNVSLHHLEHVASANSSSPLSSVTYEYYRLCHCSKRDHFIESRPSGPHVRSLLCFASGDKDPKCPYDISFISRNFRLLKVLDLECINMGTSFPSGMELLLHLRYLAVAGYIDSVPSSIANLWNLETFVVKGLKGKVNLPNSIWSLKNLRHLLVSDLAVITLQDEQQGNSSGLDYLVTLSSPFLRCGEDTDKILRQVLNLRKLKCIFSESWDNSQKCNQFPSLSVLVKLESLKISYDGRALHPGEFSFPLNLKKLTLSNFRLPWNKISVIGQLPNLEVLKLLPRAFDGDIWEMVEGEFSELKYLKLDTLNIVKWEACSEHLPKLQQLVLRCCRHLKEVPSFLGEIPTLEMINVQWCGDGVEESVKQIWEEGDEKLKVFINFAEKYFSST